MEEFDEEFESPNKRKNFSVVTQNSFVRHMFGIDYDEAYNVLDEKKSSPKKSHRRIPSSLGNSESKNSSASINCDQG